MSVSYCCVIHLALLDNNYFPPSHPSPPTEYQYGGDRYIWVTNWPSVVGALPSLATTILWDRVTLVTHWPIVVCALSSLATTILWESDI